MACQTFIENGDVSVSWIPLAERKSTPHASTGAPKTPETGSPTTRPAASPVPEAAQPVSAAASISPPESSPTKHEQPMSPSNLNYIGGQWQPAADAATFEDRNPADDRDLIATFPDSGSGDVAAAVDALRAAWPGWWTASPEVRADVLFKAADIMARLADEIAEELTREEGKTRTEARAEARRIAANFRLYAGEALRLNGETYPSEGSQIVLSLRQPVGVVAVITPWNFPLSMAARKIAPALAAGNAVLFKPSEITPLMGQRLVEVLLEAGLPARRHRARPRARCQGRPGNHGERHRRPHLHRIVRRRPPDRRGGLHRCPRPARDGRQERDGRARRCRCRQGRRHHRARRLRPHRTGVHRHQPRAGCALALRRGRRQALGRGEQDQGRAGWRGWRAHGATGDLRAIRQGPLLRPDSARRGQSRRCRWRVPARQRRRALGQRLFHVAGGHLRGAHGEPPAARGDLRAGGGGPRRRRPRRGAGDRRRDRVRPRLVTGHQRSRRRHPLRPRHPPRHCQGQRAHDWRLAQCPLRRISSIRATRPPRNRAAPTSWTSTPASRPSTSACDP